MNLLRPRRPTAASMAEMRPEGRTTRLPGAALFIRIAVTLLLAFALRGEATSHLAGRDCAARLVRGTRPLDDFEKLGVRAERDAFPVRLLQGQQRSERSAMSGYDQGLPRSLARVVRERSRSVCDLDGFHSFRCFPPMITALPSLTPTARIRTTGSGSSATS